jgi:hypothetical protein
MNLRAPGRASRPRLGKRPKEQFGLVELTESEMKRAEPAIQAGLLSKVGDTTVRFSENSASNPIVGALLEEWFDPPIELTESEIKRAEPAIQAGALIKVGDTTFRLAENSESNPIFRALLDECLPK